MAANIAISGSAEKNSASGQSCLVNICSCFAAAAAAAAAAADDNYDFRHFL